jgi:hypothetical protein
MTEHLWNIHGESASILIFAAGEREVHHIYNAIYFSERLRGVRWKWRVRMIWGNCPMHVEDEALDCMNEHDFNSSCPAFFLVLTPGKGEDAWTPRSNGMINCSEQIDPDDLSFLHKNTSDSISNKQREGRVGRVRHSLVLHLADGVEPVRRWVMPYPERLQVCLAAMDLGVTGDLPGLSACQQREVEMDLVIGVIVFKIGAVGDPACRISLLLSFRFPCMVFQSSAYFGYAVPVTALFLKTPYWSEFFLRFFICLVY